MPSTGIIHWPTHFPNFSLYAQKEFLKPAFQYFLHSEINAQSWEYFIFPNLSQ